ncbi:hypothetical protein CF327_g6335 [Tilletia walkeri]|nr:hypothetical protein CF327_g6335 [Tilletia walkeri]
MLEILWPNLRRFQLVLKNNVQVNSASFRPTLLGFLLRHASLVDISINVRELAAVTEPFNWSGLNFPNLRSYDIQGLWPNDAAKLAFARQHETIESLVLDLDDDDSGAFASPETVKSLHTLRISGGSLMEDFLRAGAPLTLVHLTNTHLDTDWEVNDDVSDILSLDDLPSSSVTCLDVNLYGLNSDKVVFLLENLVQRGLLDGLVELAVHFSTGESFQRRDSCRQSMNVLAKILTKLSDPRITALRALWVGYQAADDLPSDSELRTVVKKIPRRLRYISWHVPSSNTTPFLSHSFSITLLLKRYVGTGSFTTSATAATPSIVPTHGR